MKLLESIEETYLGKPVPKKYQKRYGKKYSKEEAGKIIVIFL